MKNLTEVSTVRSLLSMNRLFTFCFFLKDIMYSWINLESKRWHLHVERLSSDIVLRARFSPVCSWGVFFGGQNAKPFNSIVWPQLPMNRLSTFFEIHVFMEWWSLYLEKCNLLPKIIEAFELTIIYDFL